MLPPILWMTPDYKQAGNSYGYAHCIARLHDELAARTTLIDLPEALAGADHPVPADFHPEAPIALSFCPPLVFSPAPGRTNVWVTMFESPELPRYCTDRDARPWLPDDCRGRSRMADVVVVPSRFCWHIFRDVVDVPVLEMPLATDPLPVATRSFNLAHPDRPFRWLWLGAPNLRKGWLNLAEAWGKHFAHMPDVELYLKTTEADPDRAGKVTRNGNVTVDSRNLARAELVDLYATAHGFVFPTLGEGFGLTLFEAMMTGLPCVATDYSGHLDFATARTCHLVPCRQQRVASDNDERRSDAPDGKYTLGIVPPTRLAAAMIDVMQHYERATAMGARGARAVRQFTWAKTADRMLQILGDVAARREAA